MVSKATTFKSMDLTEPNCKDFVASDCRDFVAFERKDLIALAFLPPREKENRRQDAI